MYKELRDELISQGAFKKEPVKIIFQTILFILVVFLGIWIINSFNELISQTFGFWLVILGSMGMSTNAHTAGHGGISDKKWVNTFFLYFGFTFFLQVSKNFWQNKHNVVHHKVPNILGQDGDIDLYPLLALTEEQHRAATGWKKVYFKYQWILFPLLLLSNAFGVLFKSWKYVYKQLSKSKNRDPDIILDLSVLILHIIVWYILPTLFFNFIDVLLFNILRLAGMSYGMYALFAPAHMTHETILLDKNIDTSDRLALQTFTAINYRTGWIGRLICGGVEYQIEHHLFPNISHTHYPKISKTVEKYCIENGYPYRSVSWGVALWRSWMALKNPKKVYRKFPRMQDLPNYDAIYDEKLKTAN